MESLVLWSGGWDSTLVLVNAVEAREVVRAIAVDVGSVWHQAQMRRARERVLERIGQLFGHDRIPPLLTVEQRYSGEGRPEKRPGGLILQPWYVSVAAPYVRDGEDLHTGFHLGDHIMRDLHELEAAFKALCSVMGKRSHLVSSLATTPKYAVIDQVAALGFEGLPWHCEGSGCELALNEPPCGSCTPCVTHQTARWQLATFGRPVLWDPKNCERRPAPVPPGLSFGAPAGFSVNGIGAGDKASAPPAET